MMREPLDAALLRPGLVDEHDAGVEIALLAGEALVDRVGDDVRDAPPVVRRGEILLAVSCWPANTSHSRNSAFSRPSPWRVMRPVTSACALIARQSGKRGTLSMLVIFSMIGRRIDRREQAAALQIVGDDLRDVARGVGIARRAADEIRHRDRHRLHIALRDVELEHCAAPGEGEQQRARRRRRRSRRRRVSQNGETEANIVMA